MQDAEISLEKGQKSKNKRDKKPKNKRRYVRVMIYTGTAGYSYKDWIGPFYPKGIKDGDMLEYYSRYFDFTEVNSTYYHMPSLRLFESLNRKTPNSFRFAVKLFGGFTHEKTAGTVEAEQFKYAIKPLLESKKLICLLVQFPYSFHFKPENMDYLKTLGEWFEGIGICIEFRNNNWIRKEVIDLMKNENLGFVCVDEPRIKGLIGNTLAVTSKISYIRMHGRNAEKWYNSEGSERYNYLYSRDELLEWVTRIQEVEGKSDITIVSFNNHPFGKAVENAKALREILFKN